ncbi:hypothetical protein Tco_0679313 [Tanacetum coccineum]|uniref:Uncharacterized protein n=1 Tax=Tanacetum coccineum TaxID=301880 RepID=A0ABQ4XHH3_9ASTR
MAKIKTNTTMEESVTKDQANYYSGITSITVNGKAAYELKGKFLDDLRDNAFSRTNGEDTIEHIEYFLKIVDRIDLPNVHYERLRLAIFPISLVRNAKRKTHEDYERKMNNEVGEPWSKDGVPYEICDHICKPFHFKNGITKWPTFNSDEDGLCNDEELSEMVQVGYMTYFQHYEWYDELTDSSLKEEALK